MIPKDYTKLAPKSEYLETYKATYVLDLASDPRFRSLLNHVIASYALSLGNDNAMHFKMAGAKGFAEHLLSFGVTTLPEIKEDPSELEPETI